MRSQVLSRKGTIVTILGPATKNHRRGGFFDYESRGPKFLATRAASIEKKDDTVGTVGIVGTLSGRVKPRSVPSVSTMPTKKQRIEETYGKDTARPLRKSRIHSIKKGQDQYGNSKKKFKNLHICNKCSNFAA